MELQELEYKIKNMMENREIPEDLSVVIEELYNEYVDLFRENVEETVNKEYRRMPNIEEFFEGDHKDALKLIEELYREDCMEKAYDAIDTIRRIEEDNETIYTQEDKEIKVEDSIMDNSKNYGRISKITDIVLDSMIESGHNIFRNLERQGIYFNNMEYFDNTKKLIENKVRLKISEEGKQVLDTDDDEITKSIIGEYQNYLEEVTLNIAETEEKTAHQKFVDEYAVPEEQLIKIENKKEEEQEEKNKEVIKPDIEMI